MVLWFTRFRTVLANIHAGFPLLSLCGECSHVTPLHLITKLGENKFEFFKHILNQCFLTAEGNKYDDSLKEQIFLWCSNMSNLKITVNRLKLSRVSL